VDIVGQQGFLLNRHMVYSITTAVRVSLPVYLLTRRPTGCSARSASAKTIFRIRLRVGLFGQAVSFPDPSRLAS
jgi:hypothetical protein